MIRPASSAPGRSMQGPRRSWRPLPWALLLALATSACGSGRAPLGPPRPLVVHSGVRISPDPERLEEIYEWVTAEDESIELDPSFWLEPVAAEEATYPWETLIVGPDTTRYQFPRLAPDAQTSYSIYAHLHIMKRMGRLDEWLPDHADAEGYELERAIVSRVSDSWLLGRASFDTPPFDLLDQLLYAKEFGYLDEFLLTARSEEFAEERDAWIADNPGRMEAYEAWFRETFDRAPPGWEQARRR